MHLKIKDSKYFENINFKMHKSVKKERKKKKEGFYLPFFINACACTTLYLQHR